MTHRPLLCAGIVLLFALAASRAGAQVVPQGGKLIGSGSSNANQGTSVSLSADGNTGIVGGPYDNSLTGALWVFTRSGVTWSQQGSKLVGSGAAGAARQGWSVTLSADGSTALSAGTGDNGGAGAAWVFTRTGSTWGQQGTKLVGGGAVGAPGLGNSVALSADGNTAIVGGPADNGNTGAAWVFTRSGGVWSQQGPKLVGSGAVGAAKQGWSVSLSADGNTAIVGGAYDNSNVGAVWVFTRSGGAWSQQGGKLTGAGAAGAALQGYSVSVSADASTFIEGGPLDNGSVGAAWLFTSGGGVWSQAGSKLVGSAAVGTAQEGVSVALSRDGLTAALGGNWDNSHAGAVWFFVGDGGQWSQLGPKLVGPGGSSAGEEGLSVALSADGHTALAGGPIDGATWVYVRPAPQIVSISDVPNDQGGKLSLRWTASLLDAAPGNAIDSYWIWRQVPTHLAARKLAKGATLVMDGAAAAAATGPVLRATVQGTQVYYWEFAGSQASHGFPAYSYTASTASDSVADSNPYTLFMVEAEQTSAGLYWQSLPESAYSVDNLPPAAPAPFTGGHSGPSTTLHWGRNTEPDMAGYDLYRGTSADFVPGAGNLLVSKPDTGYVDPAIGAYFYKLSAVDVHGNESKFAVLAPQQIGSVPGASTAALWLGEAAPNPARGGVEVRYGLARDGLASLEIFDAAGARVRTLFTGPQTAGSKLARWDGLDGSGRRAPAGLYFYRLSTGGEARTGRLVTVH